MKRLRAATLALLAMLLPVLACAHGVGSSLLRLHLEGTHLEGDWDLNLQDARRAIGLDPTVTGEAGWAELRLHDAQLRAVLVRSVRITADSLPCSIVAAAAPTTWDGKRSDVFVPLVATCRTPPRRLVLHTDLLFDVDPKHRAYFSVEDERVTTLGALHANERTIAFAVQRFDPMAAIGEFTREGIRHIWSGFDHMLFLLALLLPATLVRAGHDWQPRSGLGGSIREVAKVVTAFTLAHTITLCLSFFGVLRPPSQWVETGIALSVFAAAWNNLRPFLPGRAWIMAFGFGLVHGLGFAGALANLSLPRHARVLALASFNVGVEVGQLVLVLLVMPILYALSRRRWYPRLVMGAGSLGIAWMAIVWVLERGFNLSLFPHR